MTEPEFNTLDQVYNAIPNGFCRQCRHGIPVDGENIMDYEDVTEIDCAADSPEYCPVVQLYAAENGLPIIIPADS